MIGHPRARLRAAKERIQVRSMMSSLRSAEFPSLDRHDAAAPEVIVSLTSYGARLGTVDLAIRSILANTIRPDRIILWLDDETNTGTLPPSLEELLPLGLEVRRGCEDLRGHKKYLWAMRENPGAVVVTIDDDVMYAPDTLKSLMAAHSEYPRSVVARRTHRITWEDGCLLPYSDWDWEWRGGSEPRMDLLPTGVGAVLYPPSCLVDEAFDTASIRACALNADDIWLKVCEVLAGTPVAWAPCRRMYPTQLLTARS